MVENRALLATLEPHAKLPRCVARFDVDDARPTTNRAVLGVDLRVPASRIDEDVVGLAAEGTLDALAS